MKNFTDNQIAEIVRDYKEAKDPFKQVGILADLNQIGKKEMAQLLAAQGCKVDGRYLAGDPRKRVPKKPAAPKKPAPKKTGEKADRHAELCRRLNEIYRKKNADYGDSFHTTWEEEGFAMARIRLSDKLSRFKTLSRAGAQQVKDESIADTLLDLANYAIMTVLEMQSDDKR